MNIEWTFHSLQVGRHERVPVLDPDPLVYPDVVVDTAPCTVDALQPTALAPFALPPPLPEPTGQRATFRLLKDGRPTPLGIVAAAVLAVVGIVTIVGATTSWFGAGGSDSTPATTEALCVDCVQLANVSVRRNQSS